MQLLLGLISLLFAGPALAVAGWIDFSSGAATLSDARGRPRTMVKGENLDAGDTVRTGANGRAQIRFTDGGYVSLQPNSEFAIKDYSFSLQADGSERGVFSLARGAMRAVTGLIGRVNRNRYQIATPTATIGIRGTGGRIEILGDGSTLIAGTSGIWTLSNAAGTIDIPAGAAGLASSVRGEPPRRTGQQPSAAPAAPAERPRVSEADNRTPSGASASVCGIAGAPACDTVGVTSTFTQSVSAPAAGPPAPNPNPPLTTGSPYLVSYSYGDGGSSVPFGNNQGQNVTASVTFDSSGRMTAFTDISGAPGPVIFGQLGGTHAEFGTAGGAIAWGRWIGSVGGNDNVPGPGPTPINLNPGANQGYHYVVGIPATAMPTAGGASFTLIGATSPTGHDGTIAPGSFTGTFTVNDWASGSISVSASLFFSSFGYSLTGSGTFTPGSPGFSGSMSGPGAGPPPSAYQCASVCVVQFNGAFYGVGAKFAGYTYLLDTGSGGKISGAAAFGR